MSTASGFRTRTPVKQEFILNRVRGDIVEGRLSPGDQLPTRQTLEQEFQVSSATLQRALDQLIRDGFIYARGSMGTFVSERLPFTTNYGVVFPEVNVPTSPWNRFWTALKNEADRIGQSGDQAGRSMPVYYGDEGHADGKEYKRLLKHIRDHRLAGLIFISPVKMYRGTPILTTPDLPRVSIATEESDGVPSLHLQDMHSKALDYLQSRGCKKIALLTSANIAAEGDVQKLWFDGAAARGMAARWDWVQGLDIRFPQTARNLIQLLMRSSAKDRPDGLLIGDDNLVEYAAAGLIDSGIKVPSDIEVVAHCNFPWPTPSVLPVKRLGYDVRECLQECTTAIDKLRSKKTLAPMVVPARFEEELRLDYPSTSGQ
jgi:DNA-binding LacI/PurR family transcriptional regulator